MDKGLRILADGIRVHARVKANSTVRERTFKGPTLAVNLDAARRWRDETRRQLSGRILPEGISVIQRAGGSALRATVAAWADPRRPSRVFAGDELPQATEWLARANAARDAGLPLPEPARSGGPAGPMKLESTPHLFGVEAQDWLAIRYNARIGAGDVLASTRDAVAGLIRNYLDPALSSLRPADIHPTEHVQPLLDALADAGLSAQTQNRVLWIIRSVFAHVRATYGVQLPDPVYGVAARRPRPDVARNDQGRVRPPISPRFAATIAGLLRTYYSPEDALVFLTLRYAGLRIGECFGLMMRDVDLTRHQLRVSKQRGTYYRVASDDGGTTTATWVMYTKTAASRRLVPVIDPLWEMIAAHHEARRNDGASPTDPLFVGGRAAPGRICHDFRTCLKDVTRSLMSREDGAEAHIKPHDLRHQVGSDLFSAGVEPVRISIFLGHELETNGIGGASAVTMRTYVHTYLGFDEDDAMPTPHDNVLADIAAKLQQHVLAWLDGAPLVAQSPNDTDEWVSIREATEMLQLDKSNIQAMIRAGHLPPAISRTRLGRNVGSKDTVLVLPRAAVQAVVDQRADIVGIDEAVRLLALAGIKMGHDRLRDIATANGIAIRDAATIVPPLPIKAYLTRDDFTRLLDIATTWRDFHRTHARIGFFTGGRTVGCLGLFRGTFLNLQTAGLIAPVSPPARLGAHLDTRDWFNVTDVLDAYERFESRRAKRKALSAMRQIADARQTGSTPSETTDTH